MQHTYFRCNLRTVCECNTCILICARSSRFSLVVLIQTKQSNTGLALCTRFFFLRRPKMFEYTYKYLYIYIKLKHRLNRSIYIYTYNYGPGRSLRWLQQKAVFLKLTFFISFNHLSNFFLDLTPFISFRSSGEIKDSMSINRQAEDGKISACDCRARASFSQVHKVSYAS